jgi:hypothetical protein
MALPELIRRSAEKILTRYCSGHLFSGNRDEMRLTFDSRDDHITLFAERTDSGNSTAGVSAPVARFRFSHELGQWTLHYLDDDQRWRFYLNVSPSLDLGKLLQHLDTDPLHLFWE